MNKGECFMYTKNLKKYLFLLIGIMLILPISTHAGELNWGGVNIECIYEDGGAYSSNTKSSTATGYCPTFGTSDCLDSNGKITDSCGMWGKSAENCVGKEPGEAYSYNKVSYKTNRMTYNLKGVSNQESATTGNTEFTNQPFSSNKCYQKYIYNNI